MARKKAKAARRVDYFKYNPVTDGEQTFNIDKALNQNWDKTADEFERQEGEIEKVRTEIENIDIPTELPANGGNADTVDGKHADYFMPKSGGTFTNNVIFDKYLMLDAWDGYGTGTANFWYDGTAKRLKIDNGVTDIQVGDNLVYHTGRKPTKADVGLSNVPNYPHSGATNDPSESKLATTGGVKKAFDKGVEALNRANEAFQSASSGKQAIATAITGKGVPASGSDTHATLANKIGQIKTTAPVPPDGKGITPYLNQRGLPYQKYTDFIGGVPSQIILNKTLTSATIAIIRITRLGYSAFFNTTADIYVDGKRWLKGSEVEIILGHGSTEPERWCFIYNPSNVPIKITRIAGDYNWNNGGMNVYEIA